MLYFYIDYKKREVVHLQIMMLRSDFIVSGLFSSISQNWHSTFCYDYCVISSIKPQVNNDHPCRIMKLDALHLTAQYKQYMCQITTAAELMSRLQC